MTKTEYLLTCLAEECAEVIQAVMKIQRFGMNDQWKDRPVNRVQLIAEINDLISVIQMVSRADGMAGLNDPQAISDKQDKVIRMMQYSRERGRVEGCNHHYPYTLISRGGDGVERRKCDMCFEEFTVVD